MSEAQRMLLKAVNATQRVARAASELALEIPLEPQLDEEEETAEEEEELTEGEEAGRLPGAGSEERSNPGHLQPRSISDDSTVSQPSS